MARTRNMHRLCVKVHKNIPENTNVQGNLEYMITNGRIWK